MLEIFLFFYIIFIVWVSNTILSTEKTRRICYEYISNAKFTIDDIKCVFDYHSPFSLKSWMGFKHWFYPYKF